VATVLTPANVADSDPAPDLLREVPLEVRFALGDLHYNTPDLCSPCEQDDRLLVTTKYGLPSHRRRSGGAMHFSQTAVSRHVKF
jgi:hypothetical protein